MKNTQTDVLDRSLSFIENHMVDHEFGGLYSAVDGKRVSTDDKEIYGHALMIVALYKIASVKTAEDLLKRLSETHFSAKTKRFSEVTDRYFRPHGTGLLVHANQRIVWLAARFKAAEYLGQMDLKNQLLKELRQCFEQLEAFKLIPAALSEDWKRPLSAEVNLKTYADMFFALSLLTNLKEMEFLRAFKKRLLQDLTFFMDSQAAIESVSLEGFPIIESGRRMGSMAQLAYALLAVGNTKVSDTTTHLLAEKMLNFIEDHFKNDVQGGYWNASSSDGTVQLMPASSCVHTNSPFPIIRSEDQAWYFLALNELSKREAEYRTKAMAVHQEMMGFYDEKRAGFFEGQGFWFASLKDPVVPFGRWYWVNRHSIGAYHVGNISYTPLHLKLASTQAVCLLALSEVDSSLRREVSPFTSEANWIPWKASKKPMKRDLVSTATLDDVSPEYKRYQGWLQRTSNTNGFGLTAYRSPLGFRADRCSQLFSTFHVLADLHAIGDVDGLDKEAIVRAIHACQGADGGFGEVPGHPSDIFATYCGVVGLKFLNAVPKKLEACIQYLQEAQNKDGGFGNSPGLKSDAWHTNLAVAALEALTVKPKDVEACIQFLLKCKHSNGSYSLRPSLPPEPYSAFRVISSLRLLNVEIDSPEMTIDWLHGCETKEGSYRIRPESVESFVATYHAVAALYLLESEPINSTKVNQWLLKHQIEDGGFSRSGHGPSDTTDEGFICLHASLILDKKLEPYWAALIS